MPLGLILIAAAVGAVVGLLGFAAGRAAAKPSCAHDWEVRGVEHWYTWLEGVERKFGNHTSSTTKCLWACRKCVKRDVVAYDGKWTVEQLGRLRQKEHGFATPWEGYRTK